MAMLRPSSGGLNGAAAVVLRAMTFQSSTTSARAVAGSKAIDAQKHSVATNRRVRDMSTYLRDQRRTVEKAAEVRQSDPAGSFFGLAASAPGCKDAGMQKYNQYCPVARAL